MSEQHREEILKQAADPMWKPVNPTPHRCPVCNGVGKVSAGFYNFMSESSSVAPEPCRSCFNGIVWG